MYYVYFVIVICCHIYLIFVISCPCASVLFSGLAKVILPMVMSSYSQERPRELAAAGAVDKQKCWHNLVSEGLEVVLKQSSTTRTQVVGVELAKQIQPHTVMKTDEANIMATGANWKIVGSRTSKNTTTKITVRAFRYQCCTLVAHLPTLLIVPVQNLFYLREIIQRRWIQFTLRRSRCVQTSC